MVWEYEIYVVQGYQDRSALVAILDTYGLERWELITIVCDPPTNKFIYYFKRESLMEIR